jgi:hypothetical protein
VPEWSPEPREFYRVLVFGCAEEEVPSWPQAEATVTAIFERYAGPEGLEWRNRRFLWMAVLDQ